MHAAPEVVGDNDMAEDVQRSLFDRIAELDQSSLAPWVVDEEDDLRAPEFDVLWTEPQKILAHLMIDQVLRDVPPSFRWAQEMNQGKEKHQQADSHDGVRLVNEEHGCA